MDSLSSPGQLQLPTITLLIGNMHCTSCSDAITYLLSTIPSVKNVSVSLLLRTVTFSVDTSRSSSKSPTTIGKVVNEAETALIGEGGFTILAEAAGGSSVATAPRAGAVTANGDGDEDKDGWLAKVGVQTKRARERRRREDRRRKHLEHCELCRQQESGQINHASTEHGDSSPADHTAILQPQSQTSPSSDTNSDSVLKTTLSIEGMTCASCTSSITSALKGNPQVISVDVNLLGSSGTVRHHSSLAASDVAELVEDVGFEVQVMSSIPEHASSHPSSGTEITRKSSSKSKSTFLIEGMTCASCTGSITAALKDQPGIVSINVDLLGNRGVVVHSAEISTDAIIELIEEVGFGAELSSSKPESPNASETRPDKQTSRTVSIRVEGMFCNQCVTKVNSHLATLPLESYTPITLHSPTVSVTYIPHKPLTIRQIIRSLEDLAPEFEADVVKQQSLSERSQKIQSREVHTLAAHCAIAIIFAIPTFIDAIVGMILVPSSNSFRQGLMKSVWGAANLGTIILWPLATIVQFGVGRLFYKRAFGSLWPHMRRLVPSPLRPKRWRRAAPRPLTWRTFFSFGSMDLLVVLSTTVSYFASIAMLILDVRAAPGTESVGTYFDSCVFLIMFILVGRTLEAFARSRTTDAVSLLGTLRPDTALLVDDFSPAELSIASSSSGDTPSGSQDKAREMMPHKAEDQGIPSQAGRYTLVPVGQLEKGDLILVQPGSLPPTDGIIHSGQTTFDESSLTGESKAISKGPGDEVFTGTTNKSSAIIIRVTRLSSDTMLERIIHAVSDASSRKAPLEKLAEKLTGVFVPLIVYFALLVLAVWLSLSLTSTVEMDGQSGGRVFFALEFAISTLVVACPCGIGLAVPCANAVGNGVAAAAGILASGGGEAFLAATKVTRVVFDKTGTLTVGKSTVVDEYWTASAHRETQGREEGKEGEVDRRTIEEAVREVERASTHPLATALVEHFETAQASEASTPSDHYNTRPARLRAVKMKSSTEIPGRGVRAIVSLGEGDGGLEVLVGNVLLMKEHGVLLSSEQEEVISRWSSQARSVVLVASSLLTPDIPTDTTPDSSSSSNFKSEFSSASSKYGTVPAPDSREKPDYTLRAIYALSDPPRPTSKSLLRSLREKGLAVSMLSGDNEITARAVGKELGLEEGEVKGGVGPEGKAEVIRLFQSGEILSSNGNGNKQVGKGGREVVMFVGDGLNDSVALAAADVSVAMGHGSQATLASADFVLLSSDLASIPALLSISRKIVNRQRLNLLWAIVFNLVCLPFAAGFFYTIHGKGVRLSPVWSAVLMALSSVSVVTSSLALRWGL